MPGWNLLKRIRIVEAAVLTQQNRITRMAAIEAELQADLDAIKAGVTAVAAKVAAQSQAIADLQAQIGVGSPVSQDQLEALKAEADGIVTALSAI